MKVWERLSAVTGDESTRYLTVILVDLITRSRGEAGSALH